LTFSLLSEAHPFFIFHITLGVQASTQCAATPSESVHSSVHSVCCYTKRERPLTRPLSVLLHQARSSTQASTQCTPTPSESVHSSVHSVCCYTKRERALKRPLSVLLYQARASTQCTPTPSESVHSSVHSVCCYTKRERALKRPLSVLLHQAKACTQASTQCAATPSERGVQSSVKRSHSAFLHPARARNTATYSTRECGTVNGSFTLSMVMVMLARFLPLR
jgi:hypothetical protein